MNEGLILGLATYLMALTSGYYVLRLGSMFRRRHYLVVGSVILLASTTIPPILLTVYVEEPIRKFLLLLEEYPVIHVFLFTLAFASMISLARERLKEMKSQGEEEDFFTNDAFIYVMSLMAAALYYLFFVILLSVMMAIVFTLTVSTIVTLSVFKIAMRYPNMVDDENSERHTGSRSRKTNICIE